MAQVRLTNPILVVSGPITEAHTNATTAVIDVPAKHYIPPYGVSVIVTEAFAGGTPSIDVGDDTDPDGWVDTVDITETSIGTYSGDETTTAAYAITGKYYSTADTLDVVVSASLSDGTAYVTALMYNLSAVI